MNDIASVRQLRRATEAILSRRGHLNLCEHCQWIRGYNNVRRHKPGVDCRSATCDGSGVGCSRKCLDIAWALRATLWAEALACSSERLLIAEP